MREAVGLLVGDEQAVAAHPAADGKGPPGRRNRQKNSPTWRASGTRSGRWRSPRPVGITYSHWAETQRAPELRFSATLGEEPVVEGALV